LYVINNYSKQSRWIIDKNKNTLRLFTDVIIIVPFTQSVWTFKSAQFSCGDIPGLEHVTFSAGVARIWCEEGHERKRK